MPGGPGHRARAILMNNGEDAHHAGMPLLAPGTPAAGHHPVDAGSDPTLVAVQHMCSVRWTCKACPAPHSYNEWSPKGDEMSSAGSSPDQGLADRRSALNAVTPEKLPGDGPQDDLCIQP